MKNIFRVLSQTEAMTITKQDGTETQKSTVVIQELGGKYENTYAATLIGNQVTFHPDELVMGRLRFTTHEFNGQFYQDVTVQELVKMFNR